MDIVAATHSYEAWLADLVPLYQPDLDYKHERMADQADAFPFFRGTYYGWAQRWSEAAGDLGKAPQVLAVGDLHVENFGTWRDPDGRLCWGVNDFDEADRLPYTQDLVRLAASVRFAGRAGSLNVKLAAACGEMLAGYRDALVAGGTPFVLEEQHPELRALAMSADRDPVKFWKKLTALLDEAAVDPPKAAKAALVRDLPAGGLSPQFRFRPRVGMGSLGKPRYAALAEWAGGWVARETKAATPPATAWRDGRSVREGLRMADAAGRAVRCHDPFYRVVPGWVVRRLGPRCSRIDLGNLKDAGETRHLLWSMGAEAANIHLGTARAADAIVKDLSGRPDGWLEDAARSLAKLIEQDWVEWRGACAAGLSSRSPRK